MAFCQIWIFLCLFHFRNAFFPNLLNSLRNKRLILPRSCMGFSVQVAEHPAWEPARSHPATPPRFPDRQPSCASLCSQLRVSWHKSCLKALMKTEICTYCGRMTCCRCGTRWQMLGFKMHQTVVVGLAVFTYQRFSIQQVITGLGWLSSSNSHCKASETWHFQYLSRWHSLY